MSTYGFFDEQTADNCVKAVAPVVNQAFMTIAEETGDSPAPLLAPIAAGDLASHSGMLHNKGCMDLELVVSYLDGADCDACSTDTLTLVDVTIHVEKNAKGFVLPPGLIAGATVTTGTLDPAGAFTAAPVPVGQEQKLSWNACFTPCCGTVAAVPA